MKKLKTILLNLLLTGFLTGIYFLITFNDEGKVRFKEIIENIK